MDPHIVLLIKSNLKQLRLPAMSAEFEKLARQAAAGNESCEQFLLRLLELEVTARAANVLKARIKQAAFPVHKDFDTFDFTAVPAPAGHQIARPVVHHGIPPPPGNGPNAS